MVRLLSLLLILILAACGEDDQLVVDDTGVSNFYLKNGSTVDLRVMTQPGDESFDLPRATTIEADRDVPGDIGIHAMPSDRFESIAIYLANTDSLVYEQSPTMDSLWLHATPFGSIWWERAQYTLFITDEDLTPE